MAVLPFRPTPFFRDKNRAFWRLQFLGWGGAFILRTVTSLANDKPLSFLLIVLIATIVGFSLSLLLSVAYGNLINRKPLVTWGMTALVLALAGSVSGIIDGWANSIYNNTPISDSGQALRFLLGFFYLDMTLLAAWTGLYYAINFFLQVEEQADRLERLETQATSAQLAMLRYQLNPHFLFNTLNSISTLVLLKQTDQANAMLTRLSAFLRHTLVNEPGGKVTVAEEVETLKLYLEIERMRFEERMRSRFNIDPAASHACLPSMLLQPLVENAIKYAVSAQEEGAEISVSAQLIGPRLRVTVSDTGPGLQSMRGGSNLPSNLTDWRPTSTGVGLSNIRDRLAQAYGEEHHFEIRTPPSGGFTVVIELPYERAKTGEGEALTAPQGQISASPVTRAEPQELETR